MIPCGVQRVIPVLNELHPGGGGGGGLVIPVARSMYSASSAVEYE